MRPAGLRSVAAALVLGGCALAQCGGEPPASGTGGAGAAPTGGAAGAAGAAGTPLVAGACGPIGPWGDWPPADAAPRTPEVLAPLFPRPDCGPGCRLVTTRFNGSNQRAWETRFSARLLTTGPWLDKGVIVDLDTLTEYDLSAPEPEPGCHSYGAALSGDCLIQEFLYEDATVVRGYVCQTCLVREATRGLWFGQTAPESPSWAGVTTANEHFALFAGGRDEQGLPLGRWALDLRDGSRHTYATSSWLVTNVSLAEPYIVLSEGDGEVHLIDVGDWSDTNVTNDPALQWMAASDGKTIVWIDQRYHPGGGIESPANQEVVAYDIETKVMTRLTYTDPVVAPSAKWDPAVEGDWVVWQDDRDSDAPNTTTDTPKSQVDIYGYNLATQKEYHIVGKGAGTLPPEASGPHGLLASAPRLHQGKLYVLGLYTVAPENIMIQVWEFELPPP